MNVRKIQVIIAIVVLVLWGVAVMATIFDDGENLALILTAPTSVVFGWLFAQKAVET